MEERVTRIQELENELIQLQRENGRGQGDETSSLLADKTQEIENLKEDLKKRTHHLQEIVNKVSVRKFINSVRFHWYEINYRIQHKN